MPRVAGIDPGTLTLDVCGLEDGDVFLDASWPAAELLANPEPLLSALAAAGPCELIVGPSGYGLPLCAAREVTDDGFRLAFLAAPGETGGIGGLRALARALDAAGLPLVLTPGVIHLDTVPPHRKLNRVDLGTADKLCVAALAIADRAAREHDDLEAVSFILLELGGAFTAGIAVEHGRVVDGIGGSSGPIGWRASGALDGEVAFLAGQVTKATLFQGGVESVVRNQPSLREMALAAYVEGAVRAALQLRHAAPSADEIIVSGRRAEAPGVRESLRAALGPLGTVRSLAGFATRARQGAQGAALIADGLAGGRHGAMVDRLGIRQAKGTVLDYLHVISPARARARLGLAHG